MCQGGSKQIRIELTDMTASCDSRFLSSSWSPCFVLWAPNISCKVMRTSKTGSPQELDLLDDPPDFKHTALLEDWMNGFQTSRLVQDEHLFALRVPSTHYPIRNSS